MKTFQLTFWKAGKRKIHLALATNLLTYSNLDGKSKVIYPKYFKHLPYIVAHTIDCVYSKMLNNGLNHGLNHGLFLSLFKVIPCPIH